MLMKKKCYLGVCILSSFLLLVGCGTSKSESPKEAVGTTSVGPPWGVANEKDLTKDIEEVESMDSSSISMTDDCTLGEPEESLEGDSEVSTTEVTEKSVTTIVSNEDLGDTFLTQSASDFIEGFYRNIFELLGEDINIDSTGERVDKIASVVKSQIGLEDKLELVDDVTYSLLMYDLSTQDTDKDSLRESIKGYIQLRAETDYLNTLEKPIMYLDTDLKVKESNGNNVKSNLESVVGNSIKEDIQNMGNTVIEELSNAGIDYSLSSNDIRVLIDEAYAQVCSSYANNDSLGVLKSYGIELEDLG